jgi:hypothetical protein
MPNLIKNGSFEVPVVTNPRKWDYVQTVPFWKTSVTSPKPFELWRNGVVINNRPACYSADGQQNLEILSHGPPNPMTSATVWQTAKTRKGKAHELSFAYTPRAGQHSVMTLEVNGKVVCKFDVNGTTLPNFNWMHFSFEFIAAKATTKISFTDTRTPLGGAGTHIDGVSLKQVPHRPHLLKF